MKRAVLMLTSLILMISLMAIPVVAQEEEPKVQWLTATVELAADGMYVPKLSRFAVGPSANLLKVYNGVGIVGVTAQSVISPDVDQPDNLWGPKASLDFVALAREMGVGVADDIKFSLGYAYLFDMKTRDSSKGYSAWFGTAFSYIFGSLPIIE